MVGTTNSASAPCPVDPTRTNANSLPAFRATPSYSGGTEVARSQLKCMRSDAGSRILWRPLGWAPKPALGAQTKRQLSQDLENYMSEW